MKISYFRLIFLSISYVVSVAAENWCGSAECASDESLSLLQLQRRSEAEAQNYNALTFALNSSLVQEQLVGADPAQNGYSTRYSGCGAPFCSMQLRCGNLGNAAFFEHRGDLYGTVATGSWGRCGTCYELELLGTCAPMGCNLGANRASVGKKLTVMAQNRCNECKQGHFDFCMDSNWGGTSLRGLDNPALRYREVTCPDVLLDRLGCVGFTPMPTPAPVETMALKADGRGCKGRIGKRGTKALKGASEEECQRACLNEPSCKYATLEKKGSPSRWKCTSFKKCKKLKKRKTFVSFQKKKVDAAEAGAWRIWYRNGPPPTPRPTPAPTEPLGTDECSPLGGQCWGVTYKGPHCCTQGNCVRVSRWASKCQ